MKNNLKFLIRVGLAFLAVPSLLSAKVLDVDPAHSHIGFKIKHLGFSTVQGDFKKFEGKVEVDDKTGALKSVTGKVLASSVDTNEPRRDEDLRSDHFFNVKKKGNQYLEFVSDPLNIQPGKSGKMPGKLTINGVTKPVAWNVEYAGAFKDDYNNDKASFDATSAINRKDFGLTWNQTLDKGGVLVGDEVKMELNVESQHRAKPAAVESNDKTATKKKN